MPEKTPALEIFERTVFDNAIVKWPLKLLFRILLWFRGWKVTNIIPSGAGVTIAAPHTSNWDIYYMFGAALFHDAKIYFSIKESWCRVPVIGWFIRYMGAIPIDRSADANGQVEKIRNFVQSNKTARVFFVFTPEGTRAPVQRWKSGFYHVALDAELPIFLAKVDYLKRETGLFNIFEPSGDMERDVAAIQSSYARVQAKFPAKQFPAYAGPLPEISRVEERVVTAVYELKGIATRAEIAAKAKLDALSQEMLEYLVEKGILERALESGKDSAFSSYRLTTMGSGLFLHLQPG